MKGIINRLLNKFKLSNSMTNTNTHVNHVEHVTNPTSQETEHVHRQLKPLSIKEVYTDNDVQIIGGNVEIIRKRKGLTQKQLAESLGYKSTSFISRLELWEMEKITHAQVVQLSQSLNVDIAEILHNWGKNRS
ncbi:helix-turn-helix transcriptional regulator (plasmid) [Lysinibacillus capsici]|uniref:helix-turn-helix domain-containing protein n=1 Tax=Lysinibacillus capsici TaxID=2115968 RepID=UPI0021D9E90F|nr:helix-turn-helix transcriptional regulator [Lysinibacillus capsici]UYB50409.1 helix-turn-helix transcriptional regulator [Lysinibacillus capsici]